MSTTRNRTRALGMLDPARLYNAAGLLRHAGIGHEMLRQMRTSGMVTPIDVGSIRWYSGAEVIAWMKSLGTKEAKTNNAKQPPATREIPTSG